MKLRLWLLLGLLLVGKYGFNQQGFPVILDERKRAEVVDEILEDRLDNLLPELMRREGIQMWVIISREYNEDRATHRGRDSHHDQHRRPD